MADTTQELEDAWIELYRKDRPSNLEEWLDEHPTIFRDTVVRITVLHIDRVMGKVVGIQKANNLWDGS